MQLNKENIETLTNKIILGGIDVIIALIIFAVGVWIAKRVSNATQKALRIRQLDEGLITFLKTPIYVIIVIIVGTIALNRIGIQTTSFIAVLGTMGIAVGLAFKDYLTNFTSGFLILFLKPFKIGSYIEVGTIQGTVAEIRMLNTKIISVENKSVYVPNAELISKPLVNFSENSERFLELKFNINYNQDIKQVKDIALSVLKQSSFVIRKNESVVGIWNILETNMELIVKFWIESKDFQDAKIEITEQIKTQFDKNQIQIPATSVSVNIVK